MKPRSLSRVIARAQKTFPAIVVTGPRQSGKTTLLKSLFAKTHKFVSLEDPDARIRAREDPREFLSRFEPPVMIDEIQYVPELLPYIKTRIDENRRPGRWVLTGSQQFGLMAGVSQSLAGRAAILSLLPFSLAERCGRGEKTPDVPDWLAGLFSATVGERGKALSEILLRGCYPEIASRPAVDRGLWCGSYISTYLERDVRALAQIGDLGQFERFLRACAIRTAQILNLSDLARDVGISVPTAKRWLSVLETGFQVILLYPFHENLGKRLIKSPKLYFADTALACHLMGLDTPAAVLNGPSLGPLFETMVVTDVHKRFIHAGRMPSIYYLRTRDGLEVDLIVEAGRKLHLFEIKSAMTVWPKHADALVRAESQWRDKIAAGYVISRAEGRFPVRAGILQIPWRDALEA
jgi:predicted AAA+ superfamily ATPase